MIFSRCSTRLSTFTLVATLLAFAFVASTLLLSTRAAATGKPVVIGSKKFTESITLGEILKLKLQNDRIDTVHKAELGGTRILWNALVAGNIDVYVEYSGTLSEEILRAKFSSVDDLNSLLKPQGVMALPSLGFNNTYAVGLLQSRARELSLESISDLKTHPEVKLGFANEFRQRQDGWPGLKKAYGLPQKDTRGLDHDIAYRALQTGDVDLTDLYTTDAEIAYYDLKILKDDRHYFPTYDALILVRSAAVAEHPDLLNSLQPLVGSISSDEMIAMNRDVKIDKQTSLAVASRFLKEKFNFDHEEAAPSSFDRILDRTQEHLFLVLISLTAAILIGIPLGVAAAKYRGFGKVILGVVGLIQTVPALALLAILIRPLNSIGLSGIGDTPALIALFLYSLLPIVRGTHTGLEQIPLHLRETAAVLGLSRSMQLFRIGIPLALPSILSGIKTSAVLNVGFATLGALVGAGGYGQPILAGIRLDDYGLILEGAVPAALLAICVQIFFEVFDDYLVSPGLRSKA